ncbi:hypothetical protein [Celerinatantimonas sp. YJH-8]|uniref:hypothetical protein n=1 Tax=Celerinatantimonas sp. YJH-8 TaxID=3228714 RepID=UPI0038C73FD6
MKTIKRIIALLIILIFLGLVLDGFGDVLLYSRYLYHQYFPGPVKMFLARLPKQVDHQKYATQYHDTQKLKYQPIPYTDGGFRLQAGDYGTYHIDAKGRRVLHVDGLPVANPHKRLLLLGASQSFSYYNSDADSLVAKLAVKLPDYQIDNYSVPAQPTDMNLLLWKYLNKTQKQHYDLVLVINGPSDLYHICSNRVLREIQNNRTLDQYRQPALITIPTLLIHKLHPSSKTIPEVCPANQNEQQMAVNSIYGHFHEVLAYGQTQKVPTLIIIPPTPWGTQANIDNVHFAEDFSQPAIYWQVINQLEQKTADNKNIIDLSHIYDSSKEQFFLDWAGHLTARGNALLAEKIALSVKQWRSPSHDE